MLNKTKIQEYYNDKLNLNLEKRIGSFNDQLFIMYELRRSIFEINHCIILEFYKAAITLTNNLLERTLKIALIYNEAGYEPTDISKWSDKFDGPHKKYGSIQLGNSIELCKKQELITASEKEYLFDTIRDLMRNGFAHADSDKILKDVPEKTTMTQGNFLDSSKLKTVEINQKSISFIQAIHIDKFAEQNAENYFDYVLDLITKIETRLKEKS